MRLQTMALIIGSFLTLPAVATETLQAQINAEITRVKQTYFQVPPEDIVISLKLTEDLLMESRCQEKLLFTWRGQPEPGANTLKLGCSGNNWQAYIPTQIKVFKDVVIAQEPLARGETLTPNLLSTKRIDISQLRLGYFDKPTDLAGYTVQRTVKSGQVLTPYMAKAPNIVRRGDWVTIHSGNSQLSVTMSGEALKDGQIGQQIPVKNLKSGNTIKAWIVKKGVVSTQPSNI